MAWAYAGHVTIKRFNRLTNSWINGVGGGAVNHYFEAGAIGLEGGQVRNMNYSGLILGNINNQLYFQNFTWAAGVIYGCYVMGFDMNDYYRISRFMGADTCTNSNFDTSKNMQQQVISTENITNIQSFEDPADSVTKHFFARVGDNRIYNVVPGGNITLFTTVGTSTLAAFTHRFDTGGNLKFYYCGGNGYLYEHNKNTATTKQLSWLSPTFRCKSASRTIIYNNERNSVIFSFTQNGLDGIAEYDLN